MPTKVKPLGILAGEGALPIRLIQYCIENDIPVHVVQFDECHYDDCPDIPILRTSIAKVGAIFDFFKSHQVENVVMIGGLHKPSLFSLRPDWKGVKTLFNIGKNYLRGDDNLLRSLRHEIEKEGFQVVGVDHYLTDLIAKKGILTRNRINFDYSDAVQEALRHGRDDKGQSILYHPDGTYAYETREGTEALIRQEGRKDSVLIKMVKPQQDRDLDRPVVGLETLKALHEKNCAGMVIEAEGVLMIDKEAMINFANDRDLFIEAVSSPLTLSSLDPACASSDANASSRLRDDDERYSIYMIAGETSGDVLGGNLIASLNQKGSFSIHGVGGGSMREQGLDSLFPMSDLSVMGLFEVLPRLPRLIKRINQTVADIIEKQPDVVVTIDAPDFCKRVVKKARKHCPNTQFIHYVAPTVWAWREGRAKTMAHLFDGLICLLPFEPPYFEKEGLKASFCGHPIIDIFQNSLSSPRHEECDSATNSHSGDPEMDCGLRRNDDKRDNDHILILPGSRKGEINRMAPVFAETFMRMKAMNPTLKAVIPALPHLKDTIDEHFFGMDVTYIDPKMRFEAFKKAPFALATSGTVGLELAVAECPHVIAYKMNPLTWWVVKRLVKVRFAHLVNIMEDKEIIPECIQNDCTPDTIMDAVMTYQNPDLSTIRQKLCGDDTKTPPSDQAAAFICSFL